MNQALVHRIRPLHRNLRRHIPAAAAALLLLGGVAGCGQQFGNPADPPPVAELADAVDCTAMERIFESGTQPTPATSPPAAGSVPADFVPVEAILCAAGLETLEDQDGVWSAVAEERLGGNLDALLAALAEPSDGPRPNRACTADMELVPDLWLLAADGKAMRAVWPTDSCGKTKPGVHGVLADLDVLGSSLHKLTLIQPRAALDAGCPAEWSISAIPGGLALAPLTTIPGDGSGQVEAVAPSRGLLPAADDVDSLRICGYLTASEPGPVNGLSPDAGPDTPFDVVEIVSGTFTAGGDLAGPAKDALLQAAAAEPSATECGAAATEFAALWPVALGQDTGAPLALELDGCLRLVSTDGSARTVPAEVAAAVAAAMASSPR